MIQVPLIFCVTLTRKKQRSEQAGVTEKNTESLFAKDEHSLAGIKKLLLEENSKSCSGRAGIFVLYFSLCFLLPLHYSEVSLLLIF